MAGRKHEHTKHEHNGDPGRFAYEGLERVMHEKARLGMLTSLMTHPEGLVFNELKELCSLTDGNLNRHLKVLQEASLVELWKGTRHNRPQTLCRITAEGRKRYLQYIETLERVIADAAQAAEPGRSPSSKALLKGFAPA